MSELHTRKEKRTPVTLKIKFKSATLDQFIERYSVDVSHGGIFIRTKDPLAVGTQLRFEFQLQDASPLISGDGTVVWTREFDPSRVGVAPGMGVRFDRLAPESQPILEQILTRKTGGSAASQPPRDTSRDSSPVDRFEAAAGSSPGGLHGEKTRITPPTLASSLQASTRQPPAPPMARGAGLRPMYTEEQQKDQTPLPKPMPFNIGGEDEFSEDVFDQPTKVASLESLLKHEEEHARAAQAEALAAAAAIAAVAGDDVDEDEETAVGLKPAERASTARPRHEIRVVPPVPAPILPTPSAASIDAAIDSALESDATPAVTPSHPGSEPRFTEKLQGRPEVRVHSERLRTIPSPSVVPVEKSPPGRSPVGGIALGAVLLIGAAAAVYFLVIAPSGPGADEQPAPPPTTSRGVAPAPAPTPSPAPTSAPAPRVTPPPEPASSRLKIRALPAIAMVAVDGAAPASTAGEIEVPAGRHELVFQAACHKDEKIILDTKPGEARPLEVKMKPLERVVRVATQPSDALLLVDQKPAGRTPASVRLIGRLDPKVEHVFTFRKPGYKEASTTVPPDAACATEGNVGVIGLDMTLTPISARPAPVRPAPTVVRQPIRPAPQPRPAPVPKPEPVVAPPPVEKPPEEKPPEEKPPEPAPAPKPEPIETKPTAPPEPAPAKPEPVETKPTPVPEAPKPEAAKPPEPAPAPAKPADPPKDNKDCDPSPDAPDWARCK